MNLEKLKYVYCSGIGGIGVSSVAQWFLENGTKVEGSDIVDSDILSELEKLGIKIHRNQIAENINSEIELFVYSPALPLDHPELMEAKRLNIPTKHLFEIEGMLSEKYQTIAVAGTNGKSTTTAMLSLILERTGVDPTVIVGTKILEWKTNFRSGKSDVFVVEACEYQEHFLEIKPQTAIITNIEADHLDYYKTKERVIEAFQKFIQNIKSGGNLILNVDDVETKNLVTSPDLNIFTFGENEKANLEIKKITPNVVGERFQLVDIKYKENDYSFKLHVPGKVNVYNAVSAILTGVTTGIPIEKLLGAIEEFRGTWRRFEILSKNEDRTVVTDYAHHPTAIKATIEAAKELYPEYKIAVVFQPHLHNRLETLFSDFERCFDKADKIYLLPIYKVEGRTHETDYLGLVKQLKDSIEKRTKKDNIEIIEDWKNLKNIWEKEKTPTIWLHMSAGDLDKYVRMNLG